MHARAVPRGAAVCARGAARWRVRQHTARGFSVLSRHEPTAPCLRAMFQQRNRPPNRPKLRQELHTPPFQFHAARPCGRAVPRPRPAQAGTIGGQVLPGALFHGSPLRAMQGRRRCGCGGGGAAIPTSDSTARTHSSTATLLPPIVTPRYAGRGIAPAGALAVLRDCAASCQHTFFPASPRPASTRS